jgi:small-conductance mechanosensitive channel
VVLPHAGAERIAAASMARCAAEEPGILASPKPDVLLSRLGEDGVELTLQVWVALNGGPSAPVVESRLRFAIARMLSEQGIPMGAQRTTTLVPSSDAGARPFWADADTSRVAE